MQEPVGKSPKLAMKYVAKNLISMKELNVVLKLFGQGFYFLFRKSGEHMALRLKRMLEEQKQKRLDA